MKKFLLSMAAVLTMGFAAQAATVEITAGDLTNLAATTTLTEGTTYSRNGVDFQFAKNGGSAMTAFNAAGDIRAYAKNKVTVSCATGNITEMVFNLSKQGKTQCAEITASTGTITMSTPKTDAGAADGDWTVTWTGDAASVVLTVGDANTYGTNTSKTAGQFDWDKVSVTYGGAAVETSALPVFNPETGTQFNEDGLAVSITAAEGAKIYYTLDGTNPTTASDLYEAPIALTATTTVKAIAVEEGKEASAVVEAQYIFVPTPTGDETEVTFDLAARPSGITGASDYVTEFKSGDVTLSFSQNGNGNGPKWYENGASVRMYPKNQLEIKAGREIESVVFKYTEVTAATSGVTTTYSFKGNVTLDPANADDTYVTVTPGELTEDGTVGVWTLGATEGQLTVGGKTGHGRISEIKVILKTDGPVTPTAVAPTILPATGTTFGETLEVTMTAGEGAKIYYTTDGTNPTTESTLYTAPVSISETTTFTAYAVEEGKNDSRFVTATYTKVETIKTLSKIIELGLEDENTEFTYGGIATVVYQNGSNLYIQDSSASLLVYGSGLPTYTAGDQITGFRGKFKNYYSTYELMATAASFTAGEAGPAPQPVTFDIEDITADLQNSYVMIEKVKITKDSETETDKNYTITDGKDATMPMYNKFGIEIPTENVEYNVVGVLNYYQAKGATEPSMSIYPILIDKTVGVSAVEANDLRVIVAGNSILAPAGAKIYAINGARVAADGLAAGVYVVRVADKAVKVLVK